MTLRARGLVALAAGLLSAAVVLALARFRLHGGAPDAQGRGEPVLAFDPGRVRAVELWSAGTRVRLARDGQDRDGVEALLGNLALLTRRATLSEPIRDRAALAPYGLDAPRLRISLELEGRPAERLALGGSTGEDGAAFVQPTSDEVVVIAASDAAALEARVAALAGRPDAANPAPRAGEPAPVPVPARTGG